jgi:bifunctional enzyme CysN/CysC
VVTTNQRCLLAGHRGCIIWLCGLPASGKSTLALQAEALLMARGIRTMRLDGDAMRAGLNRDLGFSPADRTENIRRAGEVARLFVEAGVVAVCSFVSPYAADRAAVRGLVGAEAFLEVFVDAPLEECIRRDPKGLYARALAGALPDMTGVGAPFERPVAPDLHLAMATMSAAEAAQAVAAATLARIAL